MSARVVCRSYIGCQRVEDLDANRVVCYQTRFWARIELDELNPEHEMTARRLVSPREFRSELFWGEEKSAGMILDRGLAIEQDLGNWGPGDSQGSGPPSWCVLAERFLD